MTNTLTLVGNLTSDPELKFIQSGDAVVNFSVAYTPRQKNKATGEWEDGEALFMRCSMWRAAAENVAESLTRGTRVIVTGRLKQRSWEKDGQKHSSVELDVEEIGPSLRYATAEVTKAGKKEAFAGSAKSDGWGSGFANDDVPF